MFNCIVQRGGSQEGPTGSGGSWGAGGELLVMVRCLLGSKVVLDGQVGRWVSKTRGKQQTMDKMNGRELPFKTRSEQCNPRRNLLHLAAVSAACSNTFRCVENIILP